MSLIRLKFTRPAPVLVKSAFGPVWVLLFPFQTFWTVILPLALPGIIAGSIFTFSLTLGDYIIPQIIGNSRPFIGMVVYSLQGTAGDVPLAAAFTVVPMVIMGLYLALAKRLGAFNAL